MKIKARDHFNVSLFIFWVYFRMTADRIQDSPIISQILGSAAFRSQSVVFVPTRASFYDVCDVALYRTWLNELQPGSAPNLFASDLLDFWTKTPFWLPPLVWLPVAALQLSLASAATGAAGAATLAFAFALGLFFWSFLEYTFHRFLFHFIDHFERLPAWALALHFLVHGIHHRYPADPFRLVFPPVLASIFVAALYVLLGLVWFPSPWTHAIFSGVLSAYVIYDETHFFFHHCPTKIPGLMARQQKVHMQHHSKSAHSHHYGVTSPFWDHVFGTAAKE